MLSFYYVELIVRNNLPIDRPPPGGPLMFGCTVDYTSMQNFSMTLPLALRISGRLLVPLVYFIICTNLAQSS